MAEKQSLIFQTTCAASLGNSAEFLANNLLGVTRTVLVSTRYDSRTERDVYLFSPNEFKRAVELGQIKRGWMVGAAVVIDAQPIYDDGRVLHTVRTAEAIELIRLAMSHFGGHLNALMVVGDQNERAAIRSAFADPVAPATEPPELEPGLFASEPLEPDYADMAQAAAAGVVQARIGGLQ